MPNVATRSSAPRSMIRRKACMRPVKQPVAPCRSGIGGGATRAGRIGGGTTRAGRIGGGGAGGGSSASAVMALLCRRQGTRGSSGAARDGSSAGAGAPPCARLADGRSTLFGGDRGRQHVVLHLLAQGRLLDLAGGRMRDLVYEHDVVGQPPVGDLALHEAEDVVAGCALLWLEHHHQERTLVPFRMPPPITAASATQGW